MVQDVEKVNIGAGLVTYAPYNADYEDSDYPARQTIGMMKNVKLTLNRTIQKIKDDVGGTMAIFKEIATEDGGTIEFVLGEDIPEERLMQLGVGTIEEVAASTDAEVTRIVKLHKTGWQSLDIDYKTNPTIEFKIYTNVATPALIETVTITGGVTPVTGTNVVIGQQEGTYLVRRIGTSVTIESDDTIQVVAEDVNVPGCRRLFMGGVNTVSTYRVWHRKRNDDDTVNITTCKIGSAGKATIDNNPSESPGEDTFTADILVDTTKEAGKRLIQKDYGLGTTAA
ncbi:MAG TPA: hypothetical protein PKJ95_03415 [Atribacterota bacterium]|nr:hypothetical protein [Atribacterota bacterium]